MIPKFRAWDTHEEVMNRVDYVDFVNGVIGMSNENVRDYEQPIHRVNIMQYTGLKDKNGVEIYEGDYIDCKWGPDDWSGVVEFKDGSFCTNPLSDSKFPSIINECSSIKVIGNIYENPELLEEQNK